MMTTYTDLLITNDEITLDSAGVPVVIHDRDVIAQDIRHMLRESGLLEQLIAERSAGMQALLFKRIRMLVEQDSRITPGSSVVDVIQPGEIQIRADSEFGPVSMGIQI